MNNMEDSRVKPCWVFLEPCTPISQLGLSAELRNTIEEKNMLTTKTRKKILRDLSEINDTNIERDRKGHRNQAVKEILTSEVSYLSQLELIKNYFMKPVQELGILPVDEYQTLFGSIQTIYNINSELLHELRKDEDNITKAFMNIAPFFKVYSVYAYDYKKSLNILQRASISNQEFSKFLEMQESRPEVQKKLSALLITPIQRIPRYRLLLKQVLDHTSPRHPTYSLIIGCLKKVEQAAAHINNLLEEQENTQRLLELQRSLQNGYPSIIKPDRKLIKEGMLMKMSQTGSQNYKRYFVLMSDIVMYCKLKKDNPNSANSLKCSCILPLNKCKVFENLNKGAFNLICQNETLVLYHDHAHEAKEWVEALNEAIKKYVNNRRTLRKDSSSRRPAHRKQISEYQDLGISPGKPRKKRQTEDKGFGSVFKNVASNSEDSDSGINVCFPIKASKRKLIRDYDPPLKIPKYENIKPHDSLFPLREHLLKQMHSNTASLSETEDERQDSHYPEEVQNPELRRSGEVFVFGNKNQPRRFNFSMGGFLTSLGNSFKRMFGFGEN